MPPLDLPGAVRAAVDPRRVDRSGEYTRLVTTAIEAAANGILITDRDGTIRWVNPAFTRITGYTLEEVAGRTPRILRSGRQPDEFYRHMWETILAGRVWDGELTNRHEDGHLYVAQQTIAPVSDARGVITHFIGIQQDVTQRKWQEEMLKQRNAQLAVLATIIGTITSSLEITAVLRSIVDAVLTLLPHALGASVRMVGESGRLVVRAATPGLGERELALELEPGEGVAGLALRERRIVSVTDVWQDPRYVAVSPSSAYRSLLAVPITSGERVLGILSVTGRDPGVFTEHDGDLLTLLVGSATIAIGHAAEYAARVEAEKEIKRYSEELATMVEERTAHLRAAQVKLLEQQRLEQEVVLAAQVQASVLPHRAPDLPGYEFAGISLPARYVSGDMYDWLSHGPEHCYFGLGDIAGKGVPAAMMTSSARALLRERAARGIPPGEALTDLNRLIYDDLTHAGVFLTMVLARLDRRTAAVAYASAGHSEVLWYRVASGRCQRLTALAPPIGVLENNLVEERSIALCPGDLLLLYSDGVTEAEDSRGELFGIDRLERLVQERAALPAAALARSIVEGVDAFSGGRRSDDLTLVVARALARTVPFGCPAELREMEGPLGLVRTLARPYGDAFAYDLELAVSEILTNVVQHAYGEAGGDLRGEVRLEPDRVQVDLYDRGRSFDPASVPPRDPAQPTERGYGVHIVRQIVDQVSYWAGTDRGNHWRLVKLRRPEGAALDP